MNNIKLTNNTLVEIDKNYFVIHYVYGTGRIEDMFSFELKKVTNNKGCYVDPFLEYPRSQIVDYVESGKVVLLDSLNANYREHEKSKMI